MDKLKKILYILCGFAAFSLGIIGVVLPVLPTTPFLLLASVCFFKGSDRLDKWFKSTDVYKKHLETFDKERAMTMKQKWTILLCADFMMMFPLIIIDKLIVKIIIILAMIFKYYYFMFRIKTIKE